MKKMMHLERLSDLPNVTASKWQSWGLNQICLTPNPMVFSTIHVLTFKVKEEEATCIFVSLNITRVFKRIKMYDLIFMT